MSPGRAPYPVWRGVVPPHPTRPTSRNGPMFSFLTTSRGLLDQLLHHVLRAARSRDEGSRRGARRAAQKDRPVKVILLRKSRRYRPVEANAHHAEKGVRREIDEGSGVCSQDTWGVRWRASGADTATSASRCRLVRPDRRGRVSDGGPPRPAGRERDVVITMWGLGGTQVIRPR